MVFRAADGIIFKVYSLFADFLMNTDIRNGTVKVAEAVFYMELSFLPLCPYLRECLWADVPPGIANKPQQQLALALGNRS